MPQKLLLVKSTMLRVPAVHFTFNLNTLVTSKVCVSKNIVFLNFFQFLADYRVMEIRITKNIPKSLLNSRFLAFIYQLIFHIEFHKEFAVCNNHI